MKMEGTLVPKPWGHEQIWALTGKYCGKILHINAGQKLSLQHHNVKEETIRVLSGVLVFQWKDNDVNQLCERVMQPGEVVHVPPGTIHRMMATDEMDCDVIEVSTPELDDVIRHQDAYGRVS